MTCAEFHDLLQRRIDGEARVDKGELAAHAAACTDCRTRLAVVQRLETGLHALARPRPNKGSANKIVATVLADQRMRRRRRYVLRTATALAAAILLAVLIGQWLGRHEQKGETAKPQPPDLVVRNSTPQQEQEKPGTSLRESVTGVAQLTMHSADKTVRSFMPDTQTSEQRPSPLSTSVAPLREAGNSVTTGLEPVTDSAKRALNLFLREVPTTRRNEKRGS
jgi:hypothetical protein